MCIRQLFSGRSSLQSHPSIYESQAWSSGLAFMRKRIPDATLLTWPSSAAPAKLTPGVRVESSRSGSGWRADHFLMDSCSRLVWMAFSEATKGGRHNGIKTQVPSLWYQPNTTRTSLHALAPLSPEIVYAVCGGELELCICKKGPTGGHGDSDFMSVHLYGRMHKASCADVMRI